MQTCERDLVWKYACRHHVSALPPIRRRSSRSVSFRGANEVREPGIHNHDSLRTSLRANSAAAVVMDSGLAAARRPGMTGYSGGVPLAANTSPAR
jgi:hypothetical protein